MSDAQALTVNIKGQGGHGAMATVEGNVVLAVSLSRAAPWFGGGRTGL